MIISLSGRPGVSETQDSASLVLSRKFRKPLVTSSQCWSQWETDKRKKRESSKRHIRFLLLRYYSMTIICRDPFFSIISNMKIQLFPCFWIDTTKISLVWGPLLLLVSVCMLCWVIIYMKDIQLSLQFILIKKKNNHSGLITHIQFDSLGACCDTCTYLHTVYTHTI